MSSCNWSPRVEPWHGTQAISKIEEPLGSLKAGLDNSLLLKAPDFSSFLGEKKSIAPGQRLGFIEEGTVDQRSFTRELPLLVL